MPPLGSLSPATFLRDYWQKKPLLIKQAWPGFIPPLSADELAGLALEPEVESRLVQSDGAAWQLAQGPFSEETFAELPEQNWTLLVQAVDHWVPEAEALLEAFRFIPDWRRDDLMLSFAVPGGSVGPHFDNYDVFLLQGEGRRTWRLGQACDETSPLLDHPELRLLAEFEETACYELEPGDMLYIPPGIAHCGSCNEASMSLSIGFRAPSQREMIDELADFLLERTDPSVRYTDPNLIEPEDPAEIPDSALAQLQQQLRDLSENPALLGEWFGRLMTAPKYPELQSANDQPLPAQTCLNVTLGSRLAWRRDQEQLWLFADGASFKVSTTLTPEIQALCHHRCLELDTTTPEPLRELAQLLLHQGSLQIECDQGAFDD